MYRKVTTLISFAAFVLFWIIMCPLGMYGQESKWVDMNPVRKRYLRFHKDFAVDSVKYPIWRISKFCYFCKFRCYSSIQEGWPIFYTDQSPLHKGEYNVSGGNSPIVEWSRLRHGTPNEFNWYWCFLTMLLLDITNYCQIIYFADVALHAMKLSTPRHVDETFGISGKLSYSFNSRMSLHVFGGFLFTPVTSFSRNDYGGSVAFDITDSFGTELGIRGYREYPF